MMQSVDRRKLFLLPLLAGPVRAEPAPRPTPTHDMRNMPASWTQPDEIAMLVYPQMTALDLIGPQYMFASLMGAKVHLVAKRRELVMCDTGVGIMPTKTFDDCPKDLTVLFAPGGTAGTLAAMADAETRAFMADVRAFGDQTFAQM